MRLFWWRLRYAYYLWRLTSIPMMAGFLVSKSRIQNDPDNIYRDGPFFYAKEDSFEFRL